MIDTRDFLDSNDDGRITDADLEVARVGRDLVLDFEGIFERALGGSGYGPAAIRLEGAGAGFAVGRIEPLGDGHLIPVVTENGIVEPPAGAGELTIA